VSKSVYTTTVPTKGGYYWLRSPDKPEGGIVQVYYSRRWEAWYVGLGSGTEVPLDHPHYQGFYWCGPLAEPTIPDAEVGL
jgi:hypothetical protein